MSNKCKKMEDVSRKFLLVWIFCMSVLLSGCGVSSGGDQITKMDKKYLTEQESASPEKQIDRKDALKVPATTSKARKEGKDAKEEEKEKKKSSSEKDNKISDEEQKPSSSKEQNKSTEPKKNTSKKNNRRKASSATKNKSSRQKAASQKENPVDSERKEETDKDSDVISCYISIDCKTILSNMSGLKANKKGYVPRDGVVLKKTKATVESGCSVYDVLYQVCRDRKIHLEAAYTPMYKTYYVEGIHQLYEFDCGDLSGWSYLVNGVQPNYGCSKYEVQAGDVIAWRFTCDAGKDL